MDIADTEFQRIWDKGYSESFEATGYAELKTKLPELIQKYANPEGTALDIGCGSCMWTSKWVAPHFKRIIALDVIRAPSDVGAKVEYRQVTDRDFSCASIGDSTIDFVFSLGCLCHLSNSANLAYLQSSYRVLKPGGKALLMFANWPNHLGLSVEAGKARNREEAGPGWWYYNDAETVAQMASKTGFKTFIDLIPGCRDLFALFSKPCS
jgi:SAM-dependent methyltransferase